MQSAVPALKDFALDQIYVMQTDISQQDYLSCADLIAPLAKEKDPSIILFPSGTSSGIVAAILGIRLKTGVIAHSVDAAIDENGNLVGTVPAYGGQMLGDILCPKTTPQIATVRTGKTECIKSQKETKIVNILGCEKKYKNAVLIEHNHEEKKGISLDGADIVICGGAGIHSKANWDLLVRIADKLGAAIACTRPLLEMDWGAQEKMMIGTSGAAISPQVYLGFGISGATHHTCGIMDSKLILNINKNANAQSFHMSDYGFEADAEEVLEGLVKVLGA